MASSQNRYLEEDAFFADTVAGARVSTKGDPDRSTGQTENNTTSVRSPGKETLVRFNQRIFSFPGAGSPPPTPTKAGPGGRFGDFEANITEILDKEHPNFDDLENSLNIRKTRKNVHGLGISILELSDKLSNLSPPASPELLQNLQFPLTPLASPNLFGTAVVSKVLNRSGFLPVDAVEQGGEIRTSEVGKATLQPRNAAYELPPTPPATPKEDDLEFTDDGEEVTFTESPEFELNSGNSLVSVDVQTPGQIPQIDFLTLCLLSSVHEFKPSCTTCKSFPVNVEVFTTLTTVFISQHQLPIIKPSFQLLHPALISHIIALVPRHTANRPPRFFAPKLGSSYQEIEIGTLIRYQKFRRDEFQIKCFSHCGKHGAGYMLWKFSHQEVVQAGCGAKTEVPSLLKMARYKKSVLLRKISYYTRG